MTQGTPRDHDPRHRRRDDETDVERTMQLPPVGGRDPSNDDAEPTVYIPAPNEPTVNLPSDEPTRPFSGPVNGYPADPTVQLPSDEPTRPFSGPVNGRPADPTVPLSAAGYPGDPYRNGYRDDPYSEGYRVSEGYPASASQGGPEPTKVLPGVEAGAGYGGAQYSDRGNYSGRGGYPSGPDYPGPPNYPGTGYQEPTGPEPQGNGGSNKTGRRIVWVLLVILALVVGTVVGAVGLGGSSSPSPTVTATTTTTNTVTAPPVTTTTTAPGPTVTVTGGNPIGSAWSQATSQVGSTKVGGICLDEGSTGTASDGTAVTCRKADGEFLPHWQAQ
ncbi:hypothetical protein [Propionibacterium freudenreichii]|uniref:hypothetical protein n=1 Tax=Propionibacterium freudenreichii TaxID=1744 RepID=UPI000541C21D|nr:hypothetical protein [Propionibacterium freudenreichii]MCT2997048.1 hypothetical protein [Propionibacterium freudenreichii]MCT3002857.1 hypothetical protein [Propionibacterium freudenreichii]MDK9298960.1 hypothetical protein [Propionibacterium freudenreichii]MDK9624665.1 hypothetical protein [Propionibacterium freudenreichii]CEG95901.1 Hypothetical protein PFCIRM123_11250 [Propionibacterium freudenreichii]